MKHYHDITYLDMVKDILDHGVRKENRTGVDTIAVFSRQMRFNLEGGSIPLLTTKKMHTRSIIHEIIWYLMGSDNVKYLQDNGVRIWNEWSSPEGHLNKVYGVQWRKWENNNWMTTIEEVKVRTGQGTNKQYVPEKTALPRTKPIESKSDDMIGSRMTNNNGDSFIVIQKTSVRGSKNSKYLVEFEKTGSQVEVLRPNLRRGQVEDPFTKTIFNEGCVGQYKENPPYYIQAYNLWYNMMKRCYDTTYPEYQLYGGDGVFVDQQWRCFSNFIRDIHNIPFFYKWAMEPNKYDLDKDYYVGKCYSPKTCIFLPKQYNRVLSNLTGFKYTATNNETNETHDFTVQRWFAKRVGMKHSQAISTALKANGKTDIWTFSEIKPKKGYIFRQQMVIDQVALVIDKLRNNPNDRRLIVSAWNVGELDKMALPPCHYAFQFYVADGKLSCMLNQRSCDTGLGVPFNIVQYSILTHMFAHVTGLKPGEFIWNGGDVHIYVNHIDQLKEQMKREPYPSPTLKLNSDVKEIDDFKFEDFEIVGYEHHPLIRMEVAV